MKKILNVFYFLLLFRLNSCWYLHLPKKYAEHLVLLQSVKVCTGLPIGTIISDDIVLTTAFEEKCEKNLSVVAGIRYWFTPPEALITPVKKVVKDGDSKIVLLLLEKNLPFNQKISSVKLAPKSNKLCVGTYYTKETRQFYLYDVTIFEQSPNKTLLEAFFWYNNDFEIRRFSKICVPSGSPIFCKDKLSYVVEYWPYCYKNGTGIPVWRYEKRINSTINELHTPIQTEMPPVHNLRKHSGCNKIHSLNFLTFILINFSIFTVFHINLYSWCK